MEFEVVLPKGYVEATNTPRQLTDTERQEIKAAGRLSGIKLHRQWTNSTLHVAILCVDTILAETNE